MLDDWDLGPYYFCNVTNVERPNWGHGIEMFGNGKLTREEDVDQWEKWSQPREVYPECVCDEFELNPDRNPVDFRMDKLAKF